MILDCLDDENNKAPITLYYGCQDSKSIPFFDEFTQIHQKLGARFSVKFCANKSQDKGIHQGFVSDILTADQNQECHYYISGPPPMIDAVEEKLASISSSEDKIFKETY